MAYALSVVVEEVGSLEPHSFKEAKTIDGRAGEKTRLLDGKDDTVEESSNVKVEKEIRAAQKDKIIAGKEFMSELVQCDFLKSRTMHGKSTCARGDQWVIAISRNQASRDRGLRKQSTFDHQRVLVVLWIVICRYFRSNNLKHLHVTSRMCMQ